MEGVQGVTVTGGVAQDAAGVTVTFADGTTAHGRVAIACDGINSAIRKQFYPDEGEPRYSGINMWRGVTRWKPMLSGASMVRAGWMSHGKMVIYPIRPADADGKVEVQAGRGDRWRHHDVGGHHQRAVAVLLVDVGDGLLQVSG